MKSIIILAFLGLVSTYPQEQHKEVRYSSDCQIPWIGDGYCQPINNWSACNFDGGDCGKNCRGVTSHGGILGLYDRNCCTREEPCAINQGDCDRSYQCQGNLVCGKDNCGKGFPRSADCCEPGTGKTCDGHPYDRSCCTRKAPCGINQGDCDRDNQCSGNLVCGKNNCPVRFPSGADCCRYK